MRVCEATEVQRKQGGKGGDGEEPGEGGAKDGPWLTWRKGGHRRRELKKVGHCWRKRKVGHRWRKRLRRRKRLRSPCLCCWPCACVDWVALRKRKKKKGVEISMTGGQMGALVGQQRHGQGQNRKEESRWLTWRRRRQPPCEHDLGRCPCLCCCPLHA